MSEQNYFVDVNLLANHKSRTHSSDGFQATTMSSPIVDGNTTPTRAVGATATHNGYKSGIKDSNSTFVSTLAFKIVIISIVAFFVILCLCITIWYICRRRRRKRARRERSASVEIRQIQNDTSLSAPEQRSALQASSSSHNMSMTNLNREKSTGAIHTISAPSSPKVSLDTMGRPFDTKNFSRPMSPLPHESGLSISATISPSVKGKSPVRTVNTTDEDLDTSIPITSSNDQTRLYWSKTYGKFTPRTTSRYSYVQFPKPPVSTPVPPISSNRSYLSVEKANHERSSMASISTTGTSIFDVSYEMAAAGITSVPPVPQRDIDSENARNTFHLDVVEVDDNEGNNSKVARQAQAEESKETRTRVRTLPPHETQSISSYVTIPLTDIDNKSSTDKPPNAMVLHRSSTQSSMTSLPSPPLSPGARTKLRSGGFNNFSPAELESLAKRISQHRYIVMESSQLFGGGGGAANTVTTRNNLNLATQRQSMEMIGLPPNLALPQLPRDAISASASRPVSTISAWRLSGTMTTCSSPPIDDVYDMIDRYGRDSFRERQEQQQQQQQQDGGTSYEPRLQRTNSKHVVNLPPLERPLSTISEDFEMQYETHRKLV